MRKSIFTKINKEEVVSVIKESKSFREASKKIKTSKLALKKFCDDNNIEYSHFSYYSGYKNMINKKFGILTVKEVIKDKRTKLLCKCDCGNFKKLRADCVKDGTYISCGCLSKKREKAIGSKNHQWMGCENISQTKFNEIKFNAKKRNISFEITIEDCNNQFIKQNKKCALTGTDLFFGRIRKHYETNASLDRIDSKKGYTKDNIQWVCKNINILKNSFDEEFFIQMCNAVSKMHPRDISKIQF